MTREKIFRQATLQFMGLLLLSLSLFGVLRNFDTVQTWVSKASGEPANLVIDRDLVIGALNTPWRYFAEGGESPDFSLQPIAAKLPPLKPASLRLDHLYDFYAPVSKSSAGTITVDWTKLDALLKDIQIASASPMLVLSYMPPALSRSADITDLPANWNDWIELVRQTVEHVSGQSGLGLTNVYYEVWNEPDLFGHWKTNGDKNYLTLYENTLKGINLCVACRPYYVGGPAITAFYDAWLTKFMDFVVSKNLRLDFYSWHIYSLNPEAYGRQVERFNTLMARYPTLTSRVEPILTEWGPDSGLNPIYDNAISAAHLVATQIALPPVVHRAYNFELQDGNHPEGAKYWGRWGVLTSSASGALIKPRYQALTFLNRLTGQQLTVSGQGSWVKALATLYGGTIQMVISNFDAKDNHTETVPLNFTHLTPGDYQLTTEYLGRLATTDTLSIPSPDYQTSLILPPNTVVYLELKPTPASVLP